MTSRSVASIIRLAVIMLLATSAGVGAAIQSSFGTAHAATTYYVDCSRSSNGDGSSGAPWNALSAVNGHAAFGPGDQILFNRGTRCAGDLTPPGSGSSGGAITIDAYGTGPLPIIDGGSNEEAIKLVDQQYWDIQNVETTGGNPYGVFITGSNADTATLHHFHLTNVVVHDVGGNIANDYSHGMIYVQPGTSQYVDDVVIDGATVYNSNISNGIFVTGNDTLRNTNVTIQNSVVHDVRTDGQASGILVTYAQNVLLQNNVAYNTGNSIWSALSTNVTVQYNEAYHAEAYQNHDGGPFDIDWNSVNTTVQYNYGHDADGYCVALFSLGGRVSTNNVVRYNVCANNEQKAATAYQGDVFLDSFDAGDGKGVGSLAGVQIYNNTFYWNPNGNNALLNTTGATFSGSNPNFFKNNLIYATVPSMINSRSSMSLDNNLYWTTSGSSPTWTYNGTTYTGFSSYQGGSGQDTHGRYTDPLLNNPTYHSVGKPTTAFTLQSSSPAKGAGVNVCAGISGCDMGTRDFFGNSVTTSGSHNIGAYEGSGIDGPAGITVNDTALSYSGAGWYHATGRSTLGVTDVGDDVHATQNNGDCASYRFTGTGVSFVTELDQSQGNVDVYLDDLTNKLTTVSEYTSGSRVGQQVPYNIDMLSSGSHTLKLCKASGQWMTIDALTVHTANDTVNDTALSYSGAGWYHATGRSTLGVTDVGDDVHATQNNGDCASYSFTGTGVSFVTELDQSQGNVDVYLDNMSMKLTTVSEYTSGSRTGQQAPYNIDTLSPGSHTLKLCKASGQWMTIDAVTYQQ